MPTLQGTALWEESSSTDAVLGSGRDTARVGCGHTSELLMVKIPVILGLLLLSFQPSPAQSSLSSGL